MHEVATLHAVLEDDRRLAVQNPRTENRCNPGVRVRQCLPLTIDIEVPQRHRRDAVRIPDCEKELLVIAFRDRVDGCRSEGFRFGRGHGPEDLTCFGVAKLPVATLQLLVCPEPRVTQVAARGPVSTLSVYRHRGGDDDLANPLASGDDLLEQHARTTGIDLAVTR